MDTDILAARDCPHNAKKSTLLYQDTALLTELFKLSYGDYAKRPNLEALAFVGILRVLVEDHIEPICQQNPKAHAEYQIYYDQFKQYQQNDFKHQPHILESLTLAIAHLVRCAIDSFRFLDYPKEYQSFLKLLEDIFNNDTLIQHSKHRKAYILLEQLRQKP